MRNPRKTPRLAASIALAVGLLLAFAALGGAGLAQAGGGPGKSQYGKKVTICHKGKRTKRVPRQAVAAHLAHGDTLGRCAKHGKKAKHKAHKGHKAHQGHKAKGAKAGKAGKAKVKQHAAKQKGSTSEHPGKGKRGRKG